ncbi:MAG: ATP-binding protein [Oscillospiraceae bacterium]|jgi:hypothetical protein|nr:ATP-binding protein [Oscillospiraceae bacterium]
MFENLLFLTIKMLAPIIEIILISVMLDGFFERKYTSGWPKHLALFGLLVLLFLSDGTVFLFNLQTMLKVAGVFLISTFLYKGSLRYKIIYSAFFAILLTLSNLLSSLVVSRIPKDWPRIDSETLLFDILELVLPKVFLMTFILLLSAFIKRRQNNITFRYWLALLTVPVTTMLTLSAFQYSLELFPSEEKFFGEKVQIIVNDIVVDVPAVGLYGYIIAAVFGLIFINIMVFFLFSRLQNQIEVRSRIRLLETQTQVQSKSITQLENSYNGMRALRHDMQNHLLCMSALIEKEDYAALRQYVNTMANTVDEAAFMRISGNNAVDAILNEKLLEAKKNQISTQYDICPLDTLLEGTPPKIEPMDLCILLSNALDNAVEACKKLPEGEERFINIKIQSTEDYLVLSCANSAAAPPKRQGELFLTDKQDAENHGFGLRSMKSTVRKYKGESLMRYENGIFTLIAKLLLRWAG